MKFTGLRRPNFLVPARWRDDPQSIASLVLVYGLGMTLISDFATGVSMPWSVADAIGTLVLLTVSIAAVVLWGLYMAAALRLSAHLTSRDPTGSLLIWAAAALTVVLFLLWQQADRTAFRQTSAGVLGAVFIALAFQRRGVQEVCRSGTSHEMNGEGFMAAESDERTERASPDSKE